MGHYQRSLVLGGAGGRGRTRGRGTVWSGASRWLGTATAGVDPAWIGFETNPVRDENLAPTRRLGPGYVDWPLEEQAALVALLDGAPLPVRLLDSCAMIPKKSRSGLYGLRPLD